MSYYTTAPITSVRKENYRVNTLELDCSMPGAKPGQFVMVWLPGMDEKPFCIVNAVPLRLSIAAVGSFSKKLAAFKAGDKLSIRGPFGKGFWLEPSYKSVLLVGGGYGVAALNFLAEQCLAAGITPVMVIGARTKDDAIFENEFTRMGIEAFVSTDDGSAGFKGRPHELAEKLISDGSKFDCIYACGPEKMMEAVAKVALAHDLPSQLALERYMGCGIGVCGKCDAGGGLVCKQGPVFTGVESLKLAEFGKCHRDTMGHKKEW
jgi:dihydroorotate dehydrogenase electron transfer subunit